MQFIPLAMSLIGTIGQVVGGINQAKQESKLLRAQGDAMLAQAKTEADADRRRTAHVLSQGQAVGAAAGLDPTSGSPMAIQLNNAFQGELNALNIEAQGQRARSIKLMEAKMSKGTIPGKIFAGLAKAGGLLAPYVVPRDPKSSWSSGFDVWDSGGFGG